MVSRVFEISSGFFSRVSEMDSLKFHADFSAMTRYRTKIHESFLSFVLCFNFANFDFRV